MRQLILIALLVLVGNLLPAQSTSVVVLKATTATSAPDNDGLLREKLQSLIDQTLGSATYGSLGCRIDLEATSSQQISGMAKRTVSRYNFTISFSDYVLGFPVGETRTGAISGSGGNARQAIDNALTKLRKTFLSGEKLRTVINEHQALLPQCDELTTRLKALTEQGHETGVLAVAAQLPETSPCASAVEQLVSTIYQQRQAADCRQRIIRAKAEVVAGNTPRAARLLASVDPTQDCANDAETLLDELMEKNIIGPEMRWYRTARRSATLSPLTRRRIISNIVLEYAYQNY